MSEDNDVPSERQQENVREIATARAAKSAERAKPARKPQNDRLTKPAIFKMIADVLDQTSKKLPPIKTKFHTTMGFADERKILIIAENGVCELVNPLVVEQRLMAHMAQFPEYDDLDVTPKRAKEMVQFWIALTKPVPLPVSINWGDEQGLCFRRLPFNYVKGAECPPIFAEFLSRVTEPGLLSCFLGSLFFLESDRQQYVWLHGEGRNGKGALSRFLYKIFGQAYQTLYAPGSKGDKFLSKQLEGCRLGVFPDVNNTDFVTTEWFKQWTGGDPIRIEAKGKDSFTQVIETKFLLISNDRPSLSSEKADMRRVIFCGVKPALGMDRNYEENLWQARDHLLSYCIDKYLAHHAAHGHTSLPVDENALFGLTGEEADRFESILLQRFEFPKPEDKISSADFGDIMRDIFGRDRTSEKQFRAWLIRTHQVEPRRSAMHRWYQGIRKKNIFR